MKQKGFFVLLILMISLLISPFAMAVPGTPSISMNQTTFESGAGIQVAWNLWWGEQGTHWQLLDNGVVVFEKDIAEVSTLPQTDNCTLNFTKGDHILIIRLSNASGATDSASTTITVKNDGSGPVAGEGIYEVVSSWSGGKIVKISFAANMDWQAVVTYTYPMTTDMWSGAAEVKESVITFTPGKNGFTSDGQLNGDGYAIPEKSYILYEGKQIPFKTIPVPPIIKPDTFYMDAAEYKPTGEIRIGQVELPNVWLAGPLTVMVPNERKHWAMALAHAGQVFKNSTGIDDPYTDGNHYLATAVQESRIGADPQSATFTYPHTAAYPITYQSAADKDGFQQIEGLGGGSAYKDLQTLFPNRYGALDHQSVISGDKFATSAITAAYYNVFMYEFLVGSGFKPKDFFNKVKDPQALDRVMALVYNRGAYSEYVKNVFTTQRDYCIGLPAMIDDAGKCLPNNGDYGSLYVRQVPGFNKAMVDASKGTQGGYPGYYDSRVTWADVDYYLNRITILYPAEDIKKARTAAQSAFDGLKDGNGMIQFSTQFGKVLDAIMLAIPMDSPVTQLCKVFAKCETEK